MGRRHDTSTAIFIGFIAFCVKFVKKAYRAGRLVELLFSVPALMGAYVLWGFHYKEVPLWTSLIPILVFSVYWWILFQNEKITSVSANPKWADRDWWWKLDGWEFEEEVAIVFRLNGYKAKVTQKTSDGGIDLLLHKDDKKTIVQCKHYRGPVSVSVARELNGLKDDFKADELILIASSGVTKSCKDFIKNKPYFKILDLEDIIRMGLRPYSS